ncbi:hypothetical protein BG844_28420 [Couchioplanes caeruleus subsp. caeruleus]|uniref:ANTAR domain-containing protein n=2 Tax=Couchioplanes caeruleus TaxID=56438 RepID=A0A1K0FE24_9ACTN|nr:hypothetical protein BG844_28420 [Couchioplanes caeruleus subsp. caeruleus]
MGWETVRDSGPVKAPGGVSHPSGDAPAAIGVRDLIGQAKGILMERHKLTGEQAFAVLVRASQNTNTKLTDVATYLMESGELIERTRR